jgi:hypothetical protein
MGHKLNLHTSCTTNHTTPPPPTTKKVYNIKCVTVEISGNIRGNVRDKKRG